MYIEMQKSLLHTVPCVRLSHMLVSYYEIVWYHRYNYGWIGNLSHNSIVTTKTHHRQCVLYPEVVNSKICLWRGRIPITKRTGDSRAVCVDLCWLLTPCFVLGLSWADTSDYLTNSRPQPLVLSIADHLFQNLLWVSYNYLNVRLNSLADKHIMHATFILNSILS